MNSAKCYGHIERPLGLPLGNSFLISVWSQGNDPCEFRIPSLHHETYDQEENHALQCYKLDLLEEKCDLAALRIASYKRRSERYFNSKVKERMFKEGDLVL